MVFEPIKWWEYGRLCGESMSDEEKRVNDDAPGAVKTASAHPDTPGGAQDPRLARSRFSGSFVHGVDSKGRMIIPSGFRDALGDRFVVAPTPDFQHIALYPLGEWLNQQDRLEALTALDARATRLVEMFNKYSYTDCETDQQGRLLLPQKMRSKYLDGCREVEISGARSYIRILKAEAGAEEDLAFAADIPDPLRFMAEIQQSAGR